MTVIFFFFKNSRKFSKKLTTIVLSNPVLVLVLALVLVVKHLFWTFSFSFILDFVNFVLRFLHHGFYIVILVFYSVIVYCIL